MMILRKWFSFSKFGRGRSGVLEVTKDQLREHREVIESLRDYDEGKKDIQTADLERRLRNV